MSSQAPLSSSLHWMCLGCLSALISVAMGAFGAHALSDKLSPKYLDVFKTASYYQMIHSLALIAYGIWSQWYLSQSSASSLVSQMSTWVWMPAWAFCIGIILFSGSLYILAITEIKILGAITPFGGLAFMLGWASFAWRAYSASINPGQGLMP